MTQGPEYFRNMANRTRKGCVKGLAMTTAALTGGYLVLSELSKTLEYNIGPSGQAAVQFFHELSGALSQGSVKPSELIVLMPAILCMLPIAAGGIAVYHLITKRRYPD